VLLFFALAGLWSILTLVFLLVFAVAVAADASTGTEVGILLAWAGVTYLVWRAWRPSRRALR
jgi:threonine/homoserine/homoserine lactone efflux protein